MLNKEAKETTILFNFFEYIDDIVKHTNISFFGS